MQAVYVIAVREKFCLFSVSYLLFVYIFFSSSADGHGSDWLNENDGEYLVNFGGEVAIGGHFQQNGVPC